MASFKDMLQVLKLVDQWEQADLAHREKVAKEIWRSLPEGKGEGGWWGNGQQKERSHLMKRDFKLFTEIPSPKFSTPNLNPEINWEPLLHLYESLSADEQKRAQRVLEQAWKKSQEGIIAIIETYIGNLISKEKLKDKAEDKGVEMLTRKQKRAYQLIKEFERKLKDAKPLDKVFMQTWKQEAKNVKDVDTMLKTAREEFDRYQKQEDVKDPKIKQFLKRNYPEGWKHFQADDVFRKVRPKLLKIIQKEPAAMLKAFVSLKKVLADVAQNILKNTSGGLDYKDPQALSKAKKVDLITLPQNIQGTNCANCRYVTIKDEVNGEGQCGHPDILLPVTKHMCCGLWDNVGVQRSWGKDELLAAKFKPAIQLEDPKKLDKVISILNVAGVKHEVEDKNKGLIGVENSFKAIKAVEDHAKDGIIGVYAAR